MSAKEKITIGALILRENPSPATGAVATFISFDVDAKNSVGTLADALKRGHKTILTIETDKGIERTEVMLSD